MEWRDTTAQHQGRTPRPDERVVTMGFHFRDWVAKDLAAAKIETPDALGRHVDIHALRHTYGTLLGQCGWSSLEISRTMGNSPTIAERHYISVTDPGKRWPFRF